MDITTTYGAPGVTTSTPGMGVSGGGDDLGFLRELVRRRFGMGGGNNVMTGAGKSQSRGTMPQVYQSPESRNNYRDPLAAQKAADAYEMTRRSAATRPTGLGAQMIPGMAVDPRLLPSRFLPSSSGLSSAPGRSGAGLSPSAPEMPDESSNSGFDYLSPIDKARAISAAQRGR